MDMPCIMSADADSTNKPATFLLFFEAGKLRKCATFLPRKLQKSATVLLPYPVVDKFRRQGGAGGVPPREIGYGFYKTNGFRRSDAGNKTILWGPLPPNPRSFSSASGLTRLGVVQILDK